LIALSVCLAGLVVDAEDICAVCGKPIDGEIYLVKDQVTGEDVMVCSNCLKLPRCFICGLPVNDSGIALPDGRHLCARDAKTAVLDVHDAQQIAADVHADLDRLFARFTTFPTNVDVAVLDRIDVDQMFQPGGYDFESPNLLGCIQAKTNASGKRYAMRLMTGLPLVELKATAAHELSHAWVGENVPSERHGRLSRNAEEGFCELVAYLLMDSQHEEAQKEFILRNHYTRGQISLFIAAEQRFGFDQMLDWMRYGESSELEAGHLEKIRDIKMPVPPGRVTNGTALNAGTNVAAWSPAPVAVPKPASIRLQGILWGNHPTAIINDHTVSANDRFTLKIGATDVNLRCLEITPASVRLQNLDTGQQEELHL
jgi:hypothetical protein